MLAFGEDAYQKALERFALSIPKPRAIVIVSAHSISGEAVHVLRCEQNRIQHDFSGFPRELYEIEYTCPGSPEIADRVSESLIQAGFTVKSEPDAPLDHGIWMPLLHLYPEGDVPVVRVSLPLGLMPAQILKLGHTLSALRKENVLLIASGGAVHNLRELNWSQKNSPGAPWAVEFESWLIQALKAKNVEAIVNIEDHPLYLRAHPSDEHFLPMLFTIGAALPGDEVEVIHRGVEYETLSMLSFSLSAPEASAPHPGVLH